VQTAYTFSGDIDQDTITYARQLAWINTWKPGNWPGWWFKKLLTQ